jgi:hypothetical protein
VSVEVQAVVLLRMVNKAVSDFCHGGPRQVSQTDLDNLHDAVLAPEPDANDSSIIFQPGPTGGNDNINGGFGIVPCNPCMIDGTAYYGLTPAQCSALGGTCGFGKKKSRRAKKRKR